MATKIEQTGNGEQISLSSSAYGSVKASIGDLTKLETTAKTDLVSALNEVNQAKEGSNLIGDLSTLNTQDKTSVVAAINDNVAQLAENTTDLQQRGMNVISLGAKGDGTSIDTTIIQNAINTYANTFPIIIPKGFTFIIDNVLTLPSNTRLCIEGTIKLANGTPSTILNMIATAPQADNVWIYGSGVIDGNRTNQTQTNLDSAVNGVKFIAATNSRIIGLKIQNVPNTPLLCSSDSGGHGSHYVRMEGLELCYSGKSPRIEYHDTHDCILKNSRIHHIDNDSGWSFYGGSYNCTVENCYMHDNYADGLTVYNVTDANWSYANSKIIISNVYCFNNGQNGLSLGSGGTSGSLHYEIILSNIHAYSNNQSNIADLGGVKVYQAKKVIINGLFAHDNGNGLNGAFGLKVTADKCTIDNAHIYNNGIGSTIGIGIVANQNVLISNSFIYDDQTTPTMQYGLSVAATSKQGIVMRGVEFGTLWANSGKAIDYPDYCTLIRDCPNFTPVGFMTAPTMPASGSSYVNPHSYPCRVFLHDGTVTKLNLNGQGIGLTPGMFIVMPGDSIYLEYSSTPYWAWYGM